MKTTRQFILAALLSIIVATQARADLVNGDFEDGLNGWQAGGTATHTGYPAGNYIIFYNGDGWIWQVFDFPAGAQTLSFRYQMQSWSGQGTGSPLNDCFGALLYDPNTLEPIVPNPAMDPAFYSDDREHGITYDPAHVTLGAPGPDGRRQVTLDVSSVPADRTACLVLELMDVLDGYRSRVTVDDVQVTVPEPTGLLALLLLAVGLRGCRP